MATLNNDVWQPSAWYRAAVSSHSRSLSKLTDKDISQRVDKYFDWFKAKHGKDYDPALHEVETVADTRKGIIKPDKIVGYVDGLPVFIRSISAGGSCLDSMPPAWSQKEACPMEGRVLRHKTSAPPTFRVIYNGKRVDGFLKMTNAKACAERFIAMGDNHGK